MNKLTDLFILIRNSLKGLFQFRLMIRVQSDNPCMMYKVFLESFFIHSFTIVFIITSPNQLNIRFQIQ